MRAGSLRYPIIIQKPVTIKNEYGATTNSWQDYILTRADIRFDSGNRLNENSEIIHSYTKTFIVRHYHPITENMRIIYKGKKYRILCINPETLKQTIITELINE